MTMIIDWPQANWWWHDVLYCWNSMSNWRIKDVLGGWFIRWDNKEVGSNLYGYDPSYDESGFWSC